MNSPKKQQLTAAKPASTLLDAYEVECIRRELQSLLLNQKAGENCAAASGSLDASAEILGLRRRRRRSTDKNANPASPPAPKTKKLSGGRTRLHLGKHAVQICCGAVAASSAVANGRRPQRAGYREVEKV